MKSQKLQIILIELKLCWVLVMNLKKNQKNPKKHQNKKEGKRGDIEV